MTASRLLAGIRKNGGRVWVDQQGRLHADGVSETQIKELGDSHDLVVALLREEIATRRWENSGKDPRWWRYPEWRWNWQEQTLRPADESLFERWLRERCTADRRCSSAAKFLYWDFCEQNGQGLLPTRFLELLDAAGFAVNDGFVRSLVLGADLCEWDDVAGGPNTSEGNDLVGNDDRQHCRQDCAVVGE